MCFVSNCFFPDVYVRPIIPIAPVHWNYQANLSFQPYKIPVVSGGGAVVRKSKVKEVIVADPVGSKENNNEDENEKEADEASEDE